MLGHITVCDLYLDYLLRFFTRTTAIFIIKHTRIQRSNCEQYLFRESHKLCLYTILFRLNGIELLEFHVAFTFMFFIIQLTIYFNNETLLVLCEEESTKEWKIIQTDKNFKKHEINVGEREGNKIKV